VYGREEWVSFVLAAVEAGSFCCYVEVSAAELARLRPVSSPAINASSCQGTRPTSCRSGSSPRPCWRCPCRCPKTVVEVGGGASGRRATAQGERQLPERSQRRTFSLAYSAPFEHARGHLPRLDAPVVQGGRATWCRMKPKLMCQAGAGAESGGTMPATMSAAAATFCCTNTALKTATACWWTLLLHFSVLAGV
jgi:hypothetical protein